MASAAALAEADQVMANQTRQIDGMVQGVADQLHAGADSAVVFAGFARWFARECPNLDTAGVLIAAAVIRLAKQKEE